MADEPTDSTLDRRSVLRKTGAAAVGAVALGATAGSSAAADCMEASGGVVSNGATVYSNPGSNCSGSGSIGYVGSGQYGTVTNHYCCGVGGNDGMLEISWDSASPDGWVSSDRVDDV